MAATHVKEHDYHLVNPSPWPITASISALVMAIGLIIWMRTLGGGSGLVGVSGPWYFILGFIGVALSAFFWWRDVIREANAGDHTPVVQLHFRYGMILFIASEVMFFVAWFWAYFDASLFPAGINDLLNTDDVVGMVMRDQLTGGHWPPAPADGTGVIIPANGDATPGVFEHTFDPWGIPLLNTLILLTSGVTATWAHYALLKDDRRGLVLGLILTVILGLIFTGFQAYEYLHAAFSYAGHIYGSRRFSWRRVSTALTLLSAQSSCSFASFALSGATLRPKGTSALRPQPGIGILSTSSGYFYSRQSTFGEQGRTQVALAHTKQAQTSE
jgi:cytochrome c oxidase subunit 3